MSQEIVVNGAPVPLGPTTLDALIAERIDPATRGVAVALNDAVVPRAAWRQTRVKPGDRIEIIKVMAGG